MSAIPDVSPSGWGTRDNLGSSKSLLAYEDGSVRFLHLCDRGRRGVIVCAPLLQLNNGHSLTRDSAGRPTVSPSILCDDCGTHGYVEHGVWRSC